MGSPKQMPLPRSARFWRATLGNNDMVGLHSGTFLCELHNEERREHVVAYRRLRDWGLWPEEAAGVVFEVARHGGFTTTEAAAMAREVVEVVIEGLPDDGDREILRNRWRPWDTVLERLSCERVSHE